MRYAAMIIMHARSPLRIYLIAMILTLHVGVVVMVIIMRSGIAAFTLLYAILLTCWAGKKVLLSKCMRKYVLGVEGKVLILCDLSALSVSTCLTLH